MKRLVGDSFFIELIEQQIIWHAISHVMGIPYSDKPEIMWAVVSTYCNENIFVEEKHMMRESFSSREI